MNCEYCHTNNRKFYCEYCIEEKLQKHSEELNIAVKERDGVVQKATDFIENATFLQHLIAEKNKKQMSIEELRQKQEWLFMESNKKRLRIKELQRQIKEKQKLIQECKKRKTQAQAQPQTDTIQKKWQRVHKLTVGTRRILVKEVASLFDLRPGVIEESDSALSNTVEVPPFSQSMLESKVKEDLYICGVTLPTRPIDVSKYSKEELNAPIGLVIHMLGLTVRYLGIKLPFMIFQRGIRYYIRLASPNTKIWSSQRKMPLFLEEDDKNFEKFSIGMAMLNYNLAYLCYTQGIKIPMNQIANTLHSLMACCRAPNLGVQSHALYYQGIRDIEFPIDFQNVIKATSSRYTCSSNIMSISNNELNDKFFNVRAIKKKELGSEEEEEEDEIETIYSELYLDSDDDDDDSEQSKQPQQNAAQNEAWSLVEVAPFLRTK